MLHVDRRTDRCDKSTGHILANFRWDRFSNRNRRS